MDWPLPTTIKALRGFLGLTEYYWKLIWNNGKIVTPLTSMLKNNSFQWTNIAWEAFHNLKRATSEPHVPALPDFSKSFIVECDASGVGRIGAVLMQEGRPFLSKALKGKALFYPPMRRNCPHSCWLFKNGGHISLVSIL